MLGQGYFHKMVPRDLKKNLQLRELIYTRAKNSSRIRKGLIEACRQDMLFYINCFGWQVNPYVKGTARIYPFITRKYQEDALFDTPDKTGRCGIMWCYENDRTAVVEKSRYMGATWLFLFVQSWFGNFVPYTQFGNISKSGDAVDDGTLDSLFGKLEYIQQNLPDWMSRGAFHQKMRYEYPATKSWIKGETSTGRATRGGRSSALFVDEFGVIQADREIRESTANTAQSRFFNGTHKGIGTEFYALTKDKGIVKIQMHWVENPELNEGLYSFDKKKNKLRFWRYEEATRKILECDGPQIDYDEWWKKHGYEGEFHFNRTGKPAGGPHPGLRSPAYDKKAEEIGNERAVAEEMDIDPEGSGAQVFNAMEVKQYREEFCRPPLWVGELDYDRMTGKPNELMELENGKLELWINPSRGKPVHARYAIACDLSYGTGTTPSCVTIWNVGTKTMVGEYVNSTIAPDKLAAYVYGLGHLFRDTDGQPAHVVWESQGPGGNFGAELMRLGYRNFYYNMKDTNPLTPKRSDNPGWFSGMEAKDDLIVKYQVGMRKRLLVNRSKESVEECLVYEFDERGHVTHPRSRGKSTDPSGVGGNHGDRVISAALGWMLCTKLSGNAMLPVDRLEEVEVKFGSFEWRVMLHEMQDKTQEVWRM